MRIHCIVQVEKQIESMAVRAQKELVLLHREDAETPKGTVEWLNARGWLSSHHHIKCPKRVLTKRTEAKIVRFVYYVCCYFVVVWQWSC